MKFLIVFASVLLAVSAASVFEQWQEFKLKHGKSYKSAVEETRRFSIFQDNLKRIEEHNKKHEKGESSYTMGINKFTDMTVAEFKAQILVSNVTKPDFGRKFHASQVNANDVPSSIDWAEKGAVTDVKDQLGCGSCYAFASTAAIEGAYYLKTGQLINLSEQQMVDCSTVDGCDGGWSQAVFEYVMAHGIATLEEYPYLGEVQQCRSADGDIKIASYVNVEKGEEALKAAVGTVGPIAIAIHAENYMMYSSGIFNDQSCSKDLDHEVLLVGYGQADGTDYWRFKNSWGNNWGEAGFCRMARNANDLCGVADDASYPIIG